MTVRQDRDRQLIEIKCGGLQPGRRIWSEPLYVGSKIPMTIEFAGKVYAGNLPQPKTFTLTVMTTVAEPAVTLDELMEMPDADEVDD